MALQILRTTKRLWELGGAKALQQAIVHKLWPNSAWAQYSFEATIHSNWYDFSQSEIKTSNDCQTAYLGYFDFRSVSWFIPDFVHPYYGGIYTIFRLADYLQRRLAIQSQFVILGADNSRPHKQLIQQAFPLLEKASVEYVQSEDGISRIPTTDVAVATLWVTAYSLLRFNSTQRKFYLMQDFEPLFYPAGSTSAQVEATYRFGFYGLANTPSLKSIYEDVYGGRATSFIPCVDTSIFYPQNESQAKHSGATKVFFYGRPNHPRNGFELGTTALRILKKLLGDKVQIVSAGAQWNPADYGLQGIIDNLGLLSYSETANLYRECEAGLVLMFTRHPSYLPLELMASGCLTVTNRNPATEWLLRDKENCLLAEASATCLADQIAWALNHPNERRQIAHRAVEAIHTQYADWDSEFQKVYNFMCDPIAG